MRTVCFITWLHASSLFILKLVAAKLLAPPLMINGGSLDGMEFQISSFTVPFSLRSIGTLINKLQYFLAKSYSAR
jgi:hypothetical protein